MQEQALGGPRIKHVCRAAAVALGQPRAMVPDDIPRLSALPLHEREGITFSPATEGTNVATDEWKYLTPLCNTFFSTVPLMYNSNKAISFHFEHRLNEQ